MNGKDVHIDNNRLELIVGPMNGGKTSELGRRLRVRSVYQKVLGVNSKKDTRYGDEGMITHDGHKIDAVRVNKIEELLQMLDYVNTDVVGIDEAQFYPGIDKFIIDQLKKTTKTFIVAGLIADKDKEFFGDVYKLIPHAEFIDFKHAVCKRCGNGNVASYTACLIPFEGQEKVGGSETYESVCRKHYNEIQRENVKRSNGSSEELL